MPKLPRLTPQEAEAMLLKDGYEFIRSKGSHILHPKIIKQVIKAVEKID
ncbi:MAG: toxin-antitoxin system, toxin component, HicA family protein [Candidatus Mariimomonas ferrooxydans]